MLTSTSTRKVRPNHASGAARSEAAPPRPSTRRVNPHDRDCPHFRLEDRADMRAVRLILDFALLFALTLGTPSRPRRVASGLSRIFRLVSQTGSPTVQCTNLQPPAVPKFRVTPASIKSDDLTQAEIPAKLRHHAEKRTEQLRPLGVAPRQARNAFRLNARGQIG